VAERGALPLAAAPAASMSMGAEAVAASMAERKP
jgi:hypothetical protein